MSEPGKDRRGGLRSTSWQKGQSGNPFGKARESFVAHVREECRKRQILDKLLNTAEGLAEHDGIIPTLDQRTNARVRLLEWGFGKAVTIQEASTSTKVEVWRGPDAIDISKLSDDDLAAMEQMLERAAPAALIEGGAVPAEPEDVH